MALAADIYVYEEAEARRMSEAFDAAWEYLEQTGGELTGPSQIDNTRELLALAVISLVRETEPTVESLRNAALEKLGYTPLIVITLPAQNEPLH